MVYRHHRHRFGWRLQILDSLVFSRMVSWRQRCVAHQCIWHLKVSATFIVFFVLIKRFRLWLIINRINKNVQLAWSSLTKGVDWPNDWFMYSITSNVFCYTRFCVLLLQCCVQIGLGCYHHNSKRKHLLLTEISTFVHNFCAWLTMIVRFVRRRPSLTYAINQSTGWFILFIPFYQFANLYDFDRVHFFLVVVVCRASPNDSSFWQ